MKKLAIVCTTLMMGAFWAGCATTSPEKQREAYQNEYKRLAALPPAQMVASPNPDVANLAKMSCDLFNEFQPMMKAYVDKVETSREYTGFLNDVRYYVEQEKMSEADACKKVAADVQAADAKLAADQKVWPKILRGYAAVGELDVKSQLVKIAALVARNQKIVESVKNLSSGKSFEKEDFMGKAQRGRECNAILSQATDTLNCLKYLGDQYTRSLELEAYAR